MNACMLPRVHLVYFLDDLNMPQLDPYNTQSAIALLRQHMDYQHWLDRSKMQMKDISNTQVLAAMNPTAGSFVVNPRLSRHFWVLNVPMPELTSLFTIYASIMNGFFEVGNFRKAVKEQVMPVIKATMGIYTEVRFLPFVSAFREWWATCFQFVHIMACCPATRVIASATDAQVVQAFRKTAVNFHYEFNMRHLTNVFQGILSMPPQNMQVMGFLGCRAKRLTLTHRSCFYNWAHSLQSQVYSEGG